MKLFHIRDLIVYDGPLLTEFRSEFGNPYLCHWCDRDGETNKWIMFRISELEYMKYLKCECSLRQLLFSDIENFVFVVDTNHDGYFVNIQITYKNKLPDAYLPNDQSFYE